MSGKSSSSEPQIQTPLQPPAAPSYGQQVKDYIASLPDMLKAQTEYDPKFAQQQLELIQQYGGPISQALLDIDKGLYPQTSQLQEAVAGQALQGLGSQLPDQYAQQYLSDFNAGIGANANAPIGVNTRNIGLYNMQEDWKRYYQNLALTTSGRQPLQGGTTPNAGTSTAGMGGALDYGASTYGSYVNAYMQQPYYFKGGSGGGAGNGLGSALGTAGGAAIGNALLPGIGGAIGGGLGGWLGGKF